MNLNLKEHLCHTLSQRISLVSTLQLKTTSDWMPNHAIRIANLFVIDFGSVGQRFFLRVKWRFCDSIFPSSFFEWVSDKSHRQQIPYVIINLYFTSFLEYNPYFTSFRTSKATEDYPTLLFQIHHKISSNSM